jgi:ClpP class serine protease
MRRRGELRAFKPIGSAMCIRPIAFGSTFAGFVSQQDPFETCGQAAVVDVFGPIVAHKGDWWDSFESIEERVLAAAQSPLRGVVLRFDSPGGDALGMIECARAIRGICAKAGKPLYAFVDGMACSAAYALASAATTIVTPPAGLLGSVGVYQAMVDATAADRQMGLSFEMVSSGARKLDGNPHIPISDEARAETQRRVDGLADLFFNLVGEMRPGVSAENMRALQGGSFLGKEAVDVGLADAVGTFDEVLAMVAGSQPGTAPSAKGNTMDTDKKTAARKAFFGAMEKAFEAAFGDEEDDKDKDKAEGEPSEEDKKKDEEAKAKAKAEDEKKDVEAKAKAKADEDEKEKAKALAAKGSLEAAIALGVANAESVQSLKAELAKRDENDAREKLLELRPDFDATMRATLALAPIETVRDAVNKWPRIGGKGEPAVTPPAALSARGVQGAGGTVASALDPDTAERMDRMMGLRAEVPSGKGTKSIQGGFATEFEHMSQEQAAKRLAELTGGKAA